MSLFEGTIYSQALNKDTHLSVILPHDTRNHLGCCGRTLKEGIIAHQKPKTLILLHGLSDLNTVWVRRTSLERYAETCDLAIIMPDGEESFYNNMVSGPRFFDYVANELPQICSEMFNIAVDPENLYIGGLSMGGYGSLLIALTYPEKFAGCFSFSAAADIVGIVNNAKISTGISAILTPIFGTPPVVPDKSDLFWLAEHVSSPLSIYMTCGKQDSLYNSNIRLKKQLELNPCISLEWEEWDGIHEWGFWDVSIQKYFDKYITD